MKKTHDAIATIGSYTDATGKKAKRTLPIGAVFESPLGRLVLKLDAVPVAAGWSGWVALKPSGPELPPVMPATPPEQPPGGDTMPDEHRKAFRLVLTPEQSAAIRESGIGFAVGIFDFDAELSGDGQPARATLNLFKSPAPRLKAVPTFQQNGPGVGGRLVAGQLVVNGRDGRGRGGNDLVGAVAFIGGPRHFGGGRNRHASRQLFAQGGDVGCEMVGGWRVGVNVCDRRRPANRVKLPPVKQALNE